MRWNMRGTKNRPHTRNSICRTRAHLCASDETSGDNFMVFFRCDIQMCQIRVVAADARSVGRSFQSGLHHYLMADGNCAHKTNGPPQTVSKGNVSYSTPHAMFLMYVLDGATCVHESEPDTHISICFARRISVQIRGQIDNSVKNETRNNFSSKSLALIL